MTEELGASAGDLRSLTRRDVAKAAAAGSALLSAGGLLAACGGGRGGSSSTTTAANAPKQKAGGTLEAGITGGGPSDTLNPFAVFTQGTAARVLNLYDPLAQLNNDGVPELALAEEITANADATEWTIRVHKGVQFHDGKEL